MLSDSAARDGILGATIAANISAGSTVQPRRFTRAKQHFAVNSPVYILVFSYFVTVVLANILYLTPLARDWPALSIANFSWSDFRWPLDFEFWSLALMLPVLAPLVAVPIGKATAPLAATISKAIPEFSQLPYVLICAALYTYLFYEMHRVHALQMLVSASDPISALEARFAVLAGLGSLPRMIMESLLVFLTVYAVVRAIRASDMFWWAFVLWHICALSAGLILLNMKWPVVLFVVTLGLCVFVTAEKYPVVKSGLIMVAGLCTYLFMAAVLLRIVPVAPPSSEEMQGLHSAAEVMTVDNQIVANSTAENLSEPTNDLRNLPKPHNLPQPGIDLGTRYAADAMSTAIRFAPHLLVMALNRMAISVPYYYDVFKSEGQICGTYEDRIMKRPVPCEPTNLVYTRMFGLDGFEGRGTAPGAPNLTGFALDGWGGALACTVLTGIVLGLFLALWPSTAVSHVYMTAFIMGGYTAYFFSQLPFEGPIIYGHGMVWWTALVLAWTAIYWSFRLISRWSSALKNEDTRSAREARAQCLRLNDS